MIKGYRNEYELAYYELCEFLDKAKNCAYADKPIEITSTLLYVLTIAVDILEEIVNG